MSEGLQLCPICHGTFSIAEIETHVNLHFDTADNGSSSTEHPPDFTLENLPITPDGLIPVQTCDAQFDPDEDTVALIARAYSNLNPNPNASVVCYLAGKSPSLLLESQEEECVGQTQHFCGKRADKGYGCGYRNLQMLVSHLLTRSEQFQNVLFGGGNFVPDVASLQAWLECSWREGFDLGGMSLLDGKVQGTRKWIGTADVVTLLRQFGICAQFVDFIGTNSRHYGIRDGGNIHSQVECDFCKVSPIVGRKHSCVNVSDFDLCDHCIHNPNALNFEPFTVHGIQIIHTTIRCDGCGMKPIVGVRYLEQERPRRNLCEDCYWSGHSLDQARYHPLYQTVEPSPKTRDNKHEKLIQWVWNYFAGEAPDALDSIITTANEVNQTNKAPLYFQHQGHSRTIVGIERVVNQKKKPSISYSLIVLDPSTQTQQLVSKLRRGECWQSQVKRGIHTLQKPEYQLIYIEDKIVDPSGLSTLKTVKAKEQIWS